jgi:hypothetical protein
MVIDIAKKWAEADKFGAEGQILRSKEEEDLEVLINKKGEKMIFWPCVVCKSYM